MISSYYEQIQTAIPPVHHRRMQTSIMYQRKKKKEDTITKDYGGFSVA